MDWRRAAAGRSRLPERPRPLSFPPLHPLQAAEGWRNVPKALAAELKSLIDTVVAVDGYATDHKTKHGNQVTGQSVLLYKKNPTDSNSWLRMPRCRGFAEEDHSTDTLQSLDVSQHHD